MNKRSWVIVGAVVILGVVGYLAWKNWQKRSPPAGPAMGAPGNPLESAPSVNPIERTNPFKGIKTNPFR